VVLQSYSSIGIPLVQLALLLMLVAGLQEQRMTSDLEDELKKKHGNAMIKILYDILMFVFSCSFY
jgi:hypothetical protein